MNRNGRTLGWLLGIAVFMGAMAWVAVPFYSWFCKVTGFAGTTQVAAAGPAAGQILDEKIRIRFDANVMPGLGWTFRPMQPEMTIRIGETAMAYYEAVNHGAETVTGSASYNVSPDSAGAFFDKIECFCFTEQTLKPGERVEMPVTFFVDPEMVKDRDAGSVRDITLSYTFFRQERSAAANPARSVPPALDGPVPRAVN